jgi:hypothetical protein
MLKSFYAITAAVFMGAFSWAAGHAACGPVSSSLGITLPCVEYAGQRFQLVLDYYPNPSDPSSLYWKFNSLSMNPACGQCATVDSGLNIRNACVIYAGVQLMLNLDLYSNPSDPSSLYWRLSSFQTSPCTLTNVSGDTMACYDPTQSMAMIQCMMQCGQDVQCLLGCFGGGFKLALTFTNQGGSDTECSVAPGTKFIPSSSGVQAMMLLDVCEVVGPGTHTVCVPAFCLNSDLAAPGDGDVFSSSGTATQPCLVEIVNLVQGKTLGFDATWKVQQIVWTCTETGNLSQADREYLQGL